MTRSWCFVPPIASVATAALFITGLIESRMFSTWNHSTIVGV